ncbi:hypothetical protein IVB40_07490 [Bradyrhizobium sp. 40]|uniref:hypothetical protein n=1 Tax=Bradyrhizobium sp. 40 TaxID=2782674 RepID=UPI001FFE764D|nr:hypothetical protein [Bradyrhizobium sp. 40]UPJ43903.1 hypothetical protein IVB40_07490 [Bradyrhizobium sp. 40]
MRRSNCNRLPARGSRLIPQPAIPDYIKTSLVPARARLSPLETIEQMASDMREAAYREGGLTREGLELLGYSSAQIDTHVAAARQLANKQAVLS